MDDGDRSRGGRWFRLRCNGVVDEPDPLVRIEEPGAQRRRGPEAGIAATEPTITVTRDPRIESVAPGAGQGPSDERKGPRESQAPANAKHCLPLRVHPSLIHQDDAVQPAGGRASGSERVPPGERLEGSETEDLAAVVLDDPAHSGVAEIADTVKENDRGHPTRILDPSATALASPW